MKFVCLGYMDEQKWDRMSSSERDAMLDECFAYDVELRTNGHWVGSGQALESARTAKTLRWQGGQVVVTDGPYAETKEQLGGLGVLEARDMDHAIELMSKHPGVRLGGPFEVRPVDEEKLRQQTMADAPNAAIGSANFASLGFFDENDFVGMSTSEFEAMIEKCIAFDAERCSAGQWISGLQLLGARTAKSLRTKGGKVVVTDGPYAETKEQLGGVVSLAMQDMNQAVSVLSGHPALRFGVVIEVRPIDRKFNELFAERTGAARS